MKRIPLTLWILGMMSFFYSCDQMTPGEDSALTQEEVVKGLKAALKAGADTSAITLHRENGYFSDVSVKIPMPEEAQMIQSFVKDKPILGKTIKTLLEGLVLKINRAAEDAAITAKPIFMDAIQNITIEDGLGILKGDSTAATAFLKNGTYNSLKNTFAPKIKVSLEKDIVGGMSVQDTWGEITTNYNNLIKVSSLLYPDLKPVNSDISEYVTEKALEGLFKKVGAEEKKIRANPTAYISAIIQKVFGYLKSSSSEE